MSDDALTSQMNFEVLTEEGTDTVESEDTISLSTVFRVATWNTLADHYIRFHLKERPDDSEVFEGHHRHSLIERVLSKFIALEVDLICLQEVDFKTARDTLEASHSHLLTPTGDGKGDTRLDACYIFYRTSRWTLVGKESIVELNDLAYSGNGDAYPTNEFQRSFLRGNFGIMACLKNEISGTMVVICNAHLHWNPQFEYVKFCQIHYLCLRLRKFIRRLSRDLHYSVASVLLCGDLNSQPGSPVHSYLSTGKFADPLSLVPEEFVAQMEDTIIGEWLAQPLIQCPLHLRSAYRKCNHESGDPNGECLDFTNATLHFVGVLDYIFFSIETLKQTRRLVFPVSEEKPPLLPNSQWPSDHVALAAEFLLTKI